MTKENATTTEATLGNLAEPLLSSFGVDIDAVTRLADKAGSGIAGLYLKEAVHGLPPVIPVFINRQDGSISSVSNLFEQYRYAPTRKTGTAKVTTLDSFIDLVDRHKTEHSAIFANTDWQKPSLTAIIDYHKASEDGGDADNGKHRILYDFPLSEEWDAWIGRNGKAMSQGEFAEWIEDHITELAAPDSQEADDFRQLFGFKVAYPNEMQALSRGLQIHAETRVKSNVVLQTGEGEITWEEEHRDASGAKFVAPGLFILSIAPFYLGDKARVPVRLRYRVKEGKIFWTFQMYRPDIHITQQVLRDLENAAGATGLPAFQGTPEMSA